MRLAEGMGSMDDRSGDRRLHREFRLRLEAQDAATLLLLTLAFAVTIVLSCLSIYHFADDHSSVLFYTDPKFTPQTLQPRLTCSASDAESFLSAFNIQPQTARLRIIGRRKGDTDASAWGLRACGRQVWLWCCSLFMAERSLRADSRLPSGAGSAFDVSLDITPFITSDGSLASESDRAALEMHLHSSNPLEVLLLSKQVEWPCWEDIATNVRQRLRALGFPGEVEVRLEATEEVLIFRNLRWQNFVRSRMTEAVVLISVVGGIVWFPYLWMRMKTVRVVSHFRMNLDLVQYWEHLSDGLSATEGFRAQSQHS